MYTVSQGALKCLLKVTIKVAPSLLQIPLGDRLLLLLETFGITATILEPIPGHLWLPMAVTCYWTHKSEPRVKLQQLKALLLGIAFGELHKIIHTPGRFSES